MKIILSIFLISLSVLLASCQKEFLKERPDKALLVPSTLDDFEAILDNSYRVMNVSPYLMISSADNFYTTDQGLQAYTIFSRNAYLWEKDVFQNLSAVDWDMPYQQVFYANVVLDGLKDLSVGEEQAERYRLIEARALFYRSIAFYWLVQQFALPYNTANLEMPGIPLKLSSNVTERVFRAPIKDVYAQIIHDLEYCLLSLPDKVSLKTRPSKAAALALLARINLIMGKYREVEHYSLETLKITDELLDFNTLNASLAAPLPMALPTVGQEGNKEVIFYSFPNSYSDIISSVTKLDTNLVASFAVNDLRKKIFVNEQGNFKGSYSGSLLPFTGIAVDEVYLMLSESKVYNGDIHGALQTINVFRSKRYANDSFKALPLMGPDELLHVILGERRKELLGRSVRWVDLRRLNQQSDRAITLRRMVNGQIIALLPNSARYTFPIPSNELEANKIEQNIR